LSSSIKKALYRSTLRQIHRSGGVSHQIHSCAKLYNGFVSEARGKSSYFQIRTHREKFEKIIKNSKALNVDERVYLEVMFMKPPTDERTLDWEYPPLNWLGSEAAKEIFKYRWKELASRVEGTRATLEEYLKTISPLNLHKYFPRCFYWGVRLVHKNRLYSLAEFGAFNWLDMLGVLMVGYEENTFTEMFLATSPVVKHLPHANVFHKPHLFENGEKEVEMYFQKVVGEALRRLKNQKWRRRVMLIRDEAKTVDRIDFEKQFPKESEMFKEDWKWL